MKRKTIEKVMEDGGEAKIVKKEKKDKKKKIKF